MSKGDLVEKDKNSSRCTKLLEILKLMTVETYSKSNIIGNITAKNTELGGNTKRKH